MSPLDRFRSNNYPPEPSGPNNETAPFDLDNPLLVLSPGDRKRKLPPDFWTMRDACEGTLIVGASGGGKTSGSGASIARALLNHGCGGLVLCAKPEERGLWQETYVKEAGRLDDLIVISPDRPYPPETQWRFNFLDYELRRRDRGGGQTENVVNLLSAVVEIVEGKQELGGGDPFWTRAMHEMLRNAIDILALGQGRISLSDIGQMIATAPQSKEEADSDHWLDTSFCAQMIEAVWKKEKSPRQQHDCDVAGTYWLKHFPRMNDRTRTSIVSTFTSVADILNHGIGWELLASELNIVPEVAFTDGKIIVVDLSIQEYGELGRITNGIWKLMFQRAVLRRKVTEHPRPVFLWADEAQNFLNGFDFLYQAVARSARAATVYLTQNISACQAVLGSHGKAQADAAIANFATKIFHANGDYTTNQWAADTIGQAWTTTGGGGVSHNDGDPTINSNWTEALHYKVQPSEFTTLRKGGPANGNQVDAIVFQGGRIWNDTDDTYLPGIFLQR